MIQLKRESMLLHKDIFINRIAEETILLRDIKEIKPLDSTKFKFTILYGISDDTDTTVTLECDN